MVLKTLLRSGNELSSPTAQLQILEDRSRLPGIPFADRIAECGHAQFRRTSLRTLQINVGRVCNQTCTHCHVDAGPERRESMSSETAEQIIAFLRSSQVDTLDITGGAPEMNPNFRKLVSEARNLGKRVYDRCNLTILLANGFEWLAPFLAENRVHIIASLPCYLEENCDAQRGSGVFTKSIEAIRLLNELGYGRVSSDGKDTGLKLDLVYNPVGTGLPPPQAKLENDYRVQLDSRFGLKFNQLLTITNMPISRYLDDLLRQQKYEKYMEKLLLNFNPATLDGVMCRSLISVDWNGFLYDCDFNQMLDIAIVERSERLHISNVTDQDLIQRRIRLSNHCYGCTAGAGSSCNGSVT